MKTRKSIFHAILAFANSFALSSASLTPEEEATQTGARMAEAEMENRSLRAENERLRGVIETLLNKKSPGLFG